MRTKRKNRRVSSCNIKKENNMKTTRSKEEAECGIVIAEIVRFDYGLPEMLVTVDGEAQVVCYEGWLENQEEDEDYSVTTLIDYIESIKPGTRCRIEQQDGEWVLCGIRKVPNAPLTGEQSDLFRQHVARADRRCEGDQQIRQLMLAMSVDGDSRLPYLSEIELLK